MTNYLHYKRQLAVLDENNSEIESWITVRGNHIPIKKGQSKEEAVKSFVESKGGEYKKESYGKHYVKYGEGENKRYASPRNDLIYSDKSRAGFFGSKKEAKEYAKKLNHKDPYAGTPFAMKNYKRTVLPYEVESEEKEPEELYASKYLKRVMNGVGKEKWDKMSYGERTEAINKEKDYYRTEGRNLYFDTEKGYGIRTDDPEFEKQFFEEYSDADKEDFKDYVKGFNSVGMTNEENKKPEEKVDKSTKAVKNYKNTMSKIRGFKAKSDGTYDFETGKPKDYPDGYSVSFHQNEPDAKGNWKSDYGRYSDEDYDKNVSDMVKETGGELNIGYFAGTPEVSVWVKDFKTAVKMAKKHNQHSIWDWKAGDVWINPDYDPKKNPMKQ